MQVFTCAFCGARPETEFHYVTEAGKDFPSPAKDISAEDWAAYLHMRHNKKGESTEVWTHTTCGEMFLMTRDTADMRVLATQSLRRDPA